MDAVHMLPFREVWAADFEFRAIDGEHPDVHCMVARELKTGRTLRFWKDELQRLDAPPFDIGKDSLYVAYAAQAEYSCHLALNWRLPVNTLDLYAEFRNITNGYGCKSSLLGAMVFYGIPGIEQTHKDEMRQIAIRGGAFTHQEKQDLLAYCESDVIALDRLLPHMLPDIELPYALTRGRYTRAVATMEHNGIPLDVNALDRIRRYWPAIKRGLIDAIDQQYHVFEGTVFKGHRWLEYCATQNIPWPLTDTGQPGKSRDLFRDMANIYPQVRPMYELRSTLENMKQIDFAVGSDGRNRSGLWPFSTKTARNAPKASQFIFGPARWVRSLIKPVEGTALAYIDWSQQEFAIAAAFSNDPNMLAVYAAADPYLEFAKLAGAVPVDATKETHKQQRNQFKQCMLGTNYGMGPHALAVKINGHVLEAQDLLAAHAREFHVFNEWINKVPDHILTHGAYQTPFGWTGRPGREPNLRSLRNFPLQAAGADIMRIAAFGLVEAGIKVLAPVHDAFLIESSVDRIEQDVKTAREIMAEAGAVALGGLRLKTDAEIIKYPARYTDERGVTTWKHIIELLERQEQRGA